jgi:hypothetical protein
METQNTAFSCSHFLAVLDQKDYQQAKEMFLKGITVEVRNYPDVVLQAADQTVPDSHLLLFSAILRDDGTAVPREAALEEELTNKYTAYELAALLGHGKVLEAMCDRKRSYLEYAALHVAIEHNRIEIGSILVEKYKNNPNSVDAIRPDGSNPLTVAISRHNKEIYTLLVAHGAEITGPFVQQVMTHNLTPAELEEYSQIAQEQKSLRSNLLGHNIAGGLDPDLGSQQGPLPGEVTFTGSTGPLCENSWSIRPL